MRTFPLCEGFRLAAGCCRRSLCLPRWLSVAGFRFRFMPFAFHAVYFLFLHPPFCLYFVVLRAFSIICSVCFIGYHRHTACTACIYCDTICPAHRLPPTSTIPPDIDKSCHLVARHGRLRSTLQSRSRSPHWTAESPHHGQVQQTTKFARAQFGRDLPRISASRFATNVLAQKSPYTIKILGKD